VHLPDAIFRPRHLTVYYFCSFCVLCIFVLNFITSVIAMSVTSVGLALKFYNLVKVLNLDFD